MKSFSYKYKAIVAPVPCSKNASTPIDLQVTEDLSIYGGEIIIENALIGDYLEASVYDVDSVLPEGYRPEGWPVMAVYIEKMFIDPTSKKVSINNWPNVATIPAGFYIRVNYTAVDSGETRTAVVNLFLAKASGT